MCVNFLGMHVNALREYVKLSHVYKCTVTHLHVHNALDACSSSRVYTACRCWITTCKLYMFEFEPRSYCWWWSPCCYTWPACRYLCCPAWQLVDRV